MISIEARNRIAQAGGQDPGNYQTAWSGSGERHQDAGEAYPNFIAGT